MSTPSIPPDGIPEPAPLYGGDGAAATANAAEERLRFRDVIEHMPDHVLLIDRDGRIAYVNEALARDLGIPAEQLVGHTPEERGFTAPEFDPLRRAFRRVLEAGEPIAGDVTATTPTGLRTYSYTVTPLSGLDGGVTSVMLTSRDVTSLVEARTSLAESEEKYRNLVELAPDAILIDQDETIVFANPAAVAMVGAERREDLVGRPILDLVHPDGRERVIWNIAADLRGDESPITTVEIRRSDGMSVTVQGRGARITFGGNPAIQVVLRDVTEEKRAELALRESEERLRLAKACAGIGNWEWRLSSPAEAGSCEHVRIFDPGQDMVSIDDWRTEVLPDDLERVETERDAALARREPFELEFRYDTGQGTTGWMRVLGGGVYDEAGRLVRVLGVNMDITEQKRAEEALREREQTLQGIFRAAPVGIGMVSHRTITQANDMLCRMTGFARDELVGQDARMLYLDDATYADVGREKYAQIYADGVGAVETQWRTKNGSVRDILLSSSPVDLARPHDDVVFSALDTTRLRESERVLGTYMDDLQRSNEELQRFAYVASHDLQEPLRSIISFTQLLERRYRGKLDTDADDFIGFIIEGGNRMQRLIEDLLRLSRIETKAKPLVPTNAAEVVADALRLMETSIREAGATIEVGDLPEVMADAAQLAQVFTNLVGNALKYRRPDVPPEIRISAERTGAFWRFAVQDNGIGIEAEYFDRIFVIFQRLHTRDAYQGTGIGLAVVRKIVERHGGRTGVESTPGEGSTFYFTLPAA